MHLVQWLGIILWRWAAWVSWPLWTLRRPRGPRWWWPESRQGIHRCKLVNPEDFHVLSDLMKRLTSSGSNRYQFEFSRQNQSVWFLWNFQVNDYSGGQEISENANIINVDENRYQILVSAQNIKLKANEYVNILTLEDVSLQDNGTYICLVAKNGFTSLTFKSATVFVTSGKHYLWIWKWVKHALRIYGLFIHTKAFSWTENWVKLYGEYDCCKKSKAKNILFRNITFFSWKSMECTLVYIDLSSNRRSAELAYF